MFYDKPIAGSESCQNGNYSTDQWWTCEGDLIVDGGGWIIRHKIKDNDTMAKEMV